MNFFRTLVIEVGILIGTFVVTYLLIRSGRSLMVRPKWIDWLLVDNHRAVLFVIATALLARGMMLPFTGVPIPRINDEFSYLLMADTFSHQRLANPTPPAWEHFETFHVNSQPTYHSKYPVGQGFVLAFGQFVFHQPWIGVYLVTALFCGSICWALQAFLPAGWALLGGVFAVLRMALFCYWMNSYWGGSLAALGGALALGAIVRLFDSTIERSDRNQLTLASVFAIALLVLATSRPYEGLAFSLPLMAYFMVQIVRSRIPLVVRIRAILLPVVAIGLAGLSFMAYYNARTTGDPLTMPYVLYERTYSPLSLFIGQKDVPAPARQHDVFREYFSKFEEDYRSTKSIEGIIALDVLRLLINWWFYVGPAMSIPVLLGVLSCIVHSRLRIAFFGALFTATAVALSVYEQPHYFAVATVAAYIFAMEGLCYLWQKDEQSKKAFVFAVCLTVLITSLTKQTGSADTYTHLTAGSARDFIAKQLADKPGRHLVLVSYLPGHEPADEIVHNGAAFGEEKILWARSMGISRDKELCNAYPGRTYWSVVSDDQHVAITQLDLCH